MPVSDCVVWPPGNDGTGESNTVDVGLFEPLQWRPGQLCCHRTEKRNAVGRTGTRDNIEVMIAMPDDDRRSVIPTVEGVAGIARIALEFLGSRLPVVDRHRRHDGRQLECDVPPRLLPAAVIGPLGTAQIILVSLANLDSMPPRRAGTIRIVSLETAIVRELHQVA